MKIDGDTIYVDIQNSNLAGTDLVWVPFFYYLLAICPWAYVNVPCNAADGCGITHYWGETFNTPRPVRCPKSMGYISVPGAASDQCLQLALVCIHNLFCWGPSPEYSCDQCITCAKQSMFKIYSFSYWQTSWAYVHALFVCRFSETATTAGGDFLHPSPTSLINIVFREPLGSHQLLLHLMSRI